MNPEIRESQPTLMGQLQAAHITASIPVEEGRIAIGWLLEVRDPGGSLIHQEAWSRGGFRSDLHCLFTLALSIQRILRASRVE